jgi:hypothetical protein
MSVQTAFQPSQGQNQNLSASTASQIALTIKGTNQLRITVKAGAGDLYVYTYSSTGSSARAATTADFCIVAGQSTTFTRNQSHDAIAYISDSTAAFKLIPGEGM